MGFGMFLHIRGELLYSDDPNFYSPFSFSTLFESECSLIRYKGCFCKIGLSCETPVIQNWLLFMPSVLTLTLWSYQGQIFSQMKGELHHYIMAFKRSQQPCKTAFLSLCVSSGQKKVRGFKSHSSFHSAKLSRKL